MEYLRPQNLHKVLVERIYEFLRQEKLKNKTFHSLINNNQVSAGNRKRIILTTGEVVYPDIVDIDRKVVYEIHVKGERRGNYFNKLPEGWKGINVFFDEENNPETLVVKFVTNEIKIIKWKGIERYENYKTAIMPHVQFLKEKIKNKETEVVIPVTNMFQMLGITGKISVHSLRYVLFFEGIFLTVGNEYMHDTNSRETVFLIRQRLENDVLPPTLIAEDGTIVL